MPTATVALLCEWSLFITTSQPMLSWTLFTVFTSSLISISHSLASCSRERSRRRAMASMSGSTVPCSGSRWGAKTSVTEVLFARSTPRCARNSARILAGKESDGTPGEGAGRWRMYTAASSTVCSAPGARFCTVMRRLDSFAFPASTAPLVDAGSLIWTMKWSAG